MKKLLIIIFVLFSILFVFSYSPSIIESMVSRNNPRQSSAMLLIGSQVEYTFENGDAYIGEDKYKPNWEWIIKNLGTEAVTHISSTIDDTKHSGPIIGIKNNFVADDIDDAQGVGGGYCLPGNYICINFKGLTIDDYADYTISKTTVGLSNWNPAWSNKDCILIHSNDKDNGLKLQSGNLDINIVGSDQTTNSIWIIFNNTGSYAGIFYKDRAGNEQVAGFVNMNAGGVDKNIVDINNRRSGNIEIDLRGNFGTANNLDLVLDIQGFKGTVSNNGQDDITINLMHSANADFNGFGTIANSAEDIDLIWQNTNIGKKEEDHRSIYGIIIKDPKSNCGKDKVKLEIPWDGQEKADIEIVGASIVNKEESYSSVTITTSDEIPLGTALGASGFFSKSLDQSDISTLQDTKIIFSSNDYNVHDEVMLYNQGPKIETSLSGSYNKYESDVYMELLSGRLRYYFVFDEQINLSDASSTNELEFNFLNDNLIITDVLDTNEFSATVEKGYYMRVGEGIEIEGKRIILVNVGSAGAVILDIDGEEQIFSEDISKSFGGLNIKVLETFY